MLKHIDYRDKVIPSSFGDIIIDGEGNVTSEFKEEEQKFLLTIPGYYREGHEDEAGQRNDLDSVEQEILDKLPKSVVEHLPKNKEEDKEDAEEPEQEEPVEVKAYDDITVSQIEKELKAENVEFDKKDNKQTKYDLYVEAKQK